MRFSNLSTQTLFNNRRDTNMIRSYLKLLKHEQFIRATLPPPSADDDSRSPEFSVTFDLTELLFSSRRRTGPDGQKHACGGRAGLHTNTDGSQSPSLLIKHMQMRCLSRLTRGIIHDLWKCCAQGHFYVKSNSKFSLCQGE